MAEIPTPPETPYDGPLPERERLVAATLMGDVGLMRAAAVAKLRLQQAAYREGWAARDALAVQEQAQLLEVAKETADRLHQLHPSQYRIPVGKGICEWPPCVRLRDVIAAAEKEKL